MNNNNNKNIQVWLIVFSVVIFIGLASTVSLILYSCMDNGTPVSEPIRLQNAEVALLQDLQANAIKLEFRNITSETTEEYTLLLIDSKGKTLETMHISIDYLYENMKEYIYLPETDLNSVVFYKITEK